MIHTDDDIDSLTIRKNDAAFLRRAVRFSWIALFVAILYQCVFFPKYRKYRSDDRGGFCVGYPTTMLLKQKALETNLISTFMVLGFVSTQFYFPLMFTTMENKPLIYNLELPEQVFLHSTLCLSVILISHLFYKFLMRTTPDRQVSLLAKAGFFDPPSHLQLWVMGILGMAHHFMFTSRIRT